MAPIRRFTRSSAHEYEEGWASAKMRTLPLLAMMFGPVTLLYLVLRCEKNMCVLFQLPLVIPSHINAYFSLFATYVVLGFMALMFAFSLITSRSIDQKSKKNGILFWSQGIICLAILSILMLSVAYLRPRFIVITHNEFLRLVATTTVFCFVASLVVFFIGFFNIVKKDIECPIPLAFFFGHHKTLKVKNVELKYFFYVHVGIVAWALLDLLLLLNEAIQKPVSGPLIFLASSQYLVSAHTLAFESFLRRRPFVEHEGLGFFWLMRVLLYLPFFQVLPVYYAATTEMTLPKPAMIADCVFFLFGFVIYISSIHQKENFVTDPGAFKNFKSVSSSHGKRFLTSGYWGIVQKPDYLGYLIMWLSWTIACGFSALAVLVFAFVCFGIYLMLIQTSNLKQAQHNPAWKKYCSLVPKKILPFVY